MKCCTEAWDIFVEANCEVGAVNYCGEVCDCRRMSPTKYKVSTSNGKELRLFLVAPAEYAFFGRKESEVKSCSSF